LVIS
jgi:hypothetical protein